jgi:hypothetical protein
MYEGKREPGDVILDRAMPNASAEEREVARENLYAFAAALLRIYTRIADERRAASRDIDLESVESVHEP